MESSIDKKAEDLARRLQRATDVLLERLFAFLSKLPEEDSDDVENVITGTANDSTTSTHSQSNASGGMTLPAAAIGWLSSQYYPPPETDDVCPTIWSSVALTDRLRLLRFLLPRVTHLRITRQTWPPELPKTRPFRPSPSDSDTPSTLEPPEELNCSGISVNSALTVEEPIPRTTRQAFWRFMQGLEHHPSLNMRVFPRLQVLVLDSIPPSWVSHLGYLQPTLQVLKWNRACLYNDLPRLFAKELPSTVHTTSSTPARILPSSSSQLYAKLTHLDLSYCGVGEASGLSKVLSRCARNVQCLSLSHNDLITQKAAISGLRHAEYLIKLNLSYNKLTSLPQAHLYLGGQLQRLQLSHNQLATVKGIDRLYALQELWLDHNQIVDLSELAGICQLPQLQSLHLQGNPFEQDYPYYPKQIWTWFQEFRQASTPQELPSLNSFTITCEQWNAIVIELPPTVQRISRKVQRQQPRRKARIVDTSILTNMTIPLDGIPIQTRQRRRRPPSLPVEGTREQPRVSFSLEDVLSSLWRTEISEEELIIVQQGDVGTINILVTQSVNDDDLRAENETKIQDEEPLAYPAVGAVFPTMKKLETDLDTEDTADLSASTNTKEEWNNGVDFTNPSSPLSVTMEEIEPTTTTESATAPVPSGSETTTETTSLTNATGANRAFDVMTADWDDLLQKVARGQIPDGKPRIPIPELAAPLNNKNGIAFPEEAANLLTQEPRGVAGKLKEPRNGATFVMDTDEQSVATSTVPFRSISLPEQIYPDDFSVPSSLGTNRDDFPIRTSKFQIAEENAVYDGPQSLSDMDVLENLKMYFETYVFATSTNSPPRTDAAVDSEAQDDDDVDDWHTVAMRYPRLQLWPEDRRIQEATSPMQDRTTSSQENDDWVVAQESFVRIWEEQVVPCGKLALRRLAPNRRIRLGFHGDQLYKEGTPDPYAECRQVYLCLSSAAFYIILRADDVTKKQEEKGIKARFPNPIPNGSTFADAPWPHAVARHTFQELQKITIGFEFQRLILHFSNPAIRKTDPFVYVLLTCNKKATVSILQEIQRLVKESKRETIDLNSDVAPVTIENDSQTVMDAIQATLTPEIVGTILHYQVLKQRWKHGEERGTVRRICLVTDTKLYLMDEDYHADSHKPLEPSSTTGGAMATKKKKGQVDLSHVSYRLVDQASLKQVSEVQAAGADPTAITIVINPLSRLSRTHRWRLLCRDSEGAERLVEDVRKAMAMMEE